MEHLVGRAAAEPGRPDTRLGASTHPPRAARVELPVLLCFQPHRTTTGGYFREAQVSRANIHPTLE
eukprot:scaffold117891_cov34-Tisochrysis_lutea.AAC.1